MIAGTNRIILLSVDYIVWVFSPAPFHPGAKKLLANWRKRSVSRHLRVPPGAQNSPSSPVDTGGPDLENVRPSGGVPEWPKGSDCKSDARASVVRIHPPPPRIRLAGVVEPPAAGVGPGVGKRLPRV